MILAICFTNFGPYHLARLRALALRLADRGDRLLAYEVAGTQRLYPWRTSRDRRAVRLGDALPRPRAGVPSARRRVRGNPAGPGPRPPRRRGDRRLLAARVVAALGWARRDGRPTILMSESQAIDHPRVWWKEAVKRRRVRRCSAALVGGPRHRDYLVELGMPADRIALGYNAVDNAPLCPPRRAARGPRRPRRAARGPLLPRGQSIRPREEPPA